MTERAHNPILAKEPVPRLELFKRRPSPEPGVALVLYREGHPLITLWPGDKSTTGEAFYGKYQTVYKVDISERSFNFQCALPSTGAVFEFQAEVQVVYVVTEPAKIVESQITDPSAVLEPLVTRTLRTAAKRFQIDQSFEVEKALVQAAEQETYDVGLKVVRVFVKLQLDHESREHARKLEEVRRQKELEAAQAALEGERLSFAWDLERKKMLVEFYSALIEQGDWQLLALQLANNPDDVAAVINVLREHRQVELEQQLEALKTLLEEDALEGYQVEQAASRVLQRFVQSFGPKLETKTLEELEEREALQEPASPDWEQDIDEP